MIRQRIAVFALKRLHNHKTYYKTILGKRFCILPGVFRPDISRTSKFLARHLNVDKGDFVLDLGCGSGIQAVFAADNAKKVVAVDINEEAVKCTTSNAKLNSKRNIEARHGDLFGPVKKSEKFDLIIFNLPYFLGKSQSVIEKSWFDENRETTIRFFNEAKKHLRSGGRILLSYTSIAEPEFFEDLIRKKGFCFKIIAKKRSIIEKFFIYEIKCLS